jgi:hypothetical protein
LYAFTFGLIIKLTKTNSKIEIRQMGPPLRKKTQDKESIMNSSTSKDSSSKYSCNTPNFHFDDNISFNGNRAEFISQYKNDTF